MAVTLASPRLEGGHLRKSHILCGRKENSDKNFASIRLEAEWQLLVIHEVIRSMRLPVFPGTNSAHCLPALARGACRRGRGCSNRRRSEARLFSRVTDFTPASRPPSASSRRPRAPESFSFAPI